MSASAWKMLGVVSLAQFLGMTLWFSATAVTPFLIAEFAIPDSSAAWLTMAVQAGFVAGTLLSAVGNLADVLNARLLMFLGSTIGAASNAAVIVAPGSATVIALRFLTGASLALVYPPAMKIAAGWFRERRGFALGLLIGALTLGKAFPHLLTALFGAAWR
ncbi:MAG TPA: MFS transporter, partial [Vicinamibacterales bacterium]